MGRRGGSVTRLCLRLGCWSSCTRGCTVHCDPAVHCVEVFDEVGAPFNSFRRCSGNTLVARWGRMGQRTREEALAKVRRLTSPGSRRQQQRRSTDSQRMSSADCEGSQKSGKAHCRKPHRHQQRRRRGAKECRRFLPGGDCGGRAARPDCSGRCRGGRTAAQEWILSALPPRLREPSCLPASGTDGPISIPPRRVDRTRSTTCRASAHLAHLARRRRKRCNDSGHDGSQIALSRQRCQCDVVPRVFHHRSLASLLSLWRQRSRAELDAALCQLGESALCVSSPVNEGWERAS